MLNMGANNILCSLLGLLVIIGLTAGRSVIQHNFRENLYGAGYRRNPFISYAQEEPKPYNEENVVPYPYNLLSSSRPTEQTTPMEIHLKIAIPAFKVQLVNNEAQRNFLPFSMPPYYETPRYSPFGPIPLPIVRHLTYEDERQSVKRPENFGYADPDNIPNFLQRPLTAVFDLDSLLSKGLALEAVDSDQDELIDNILIKNIESAVDDDDDKYKNAENFQEDDVTEDSNTEDFDEFFKRLFGEIELITSNNENDNERIRYDIEPQDDTSKDSAESNEKNEEPIQDNSEVFIETLTNEPELKVPVNVDGNEDDDGVTTTIVYFETADSNEWNSIEENSEEFIENLTDAPELKVPVNVDGNEDDDGVTTTIVYFETADSNEWNSIEENSEEFIENLTDAPELKVPVNADNDERTKYNFKPDDGASKESNESNEKNEEPIQDNSEVFIETLTNEPELKVPVNVDGNEDDDGVTTTIVYFETADSNEWNSIEENSEEFIENLTDAPELKVPVNADNDERTTYNFKPDDGASKESNESNEKNEEPIQENVEVFIETLPNVAESKVPVKVDEKSDEALAYFKLYDGASKESVESNENKDEAIETAKTNDVQPIDANDESQINLHTENDNVESKSLDELLNLMYREYGLKLEWKLNDIVKEDAGDIETVTVSDVKEDPEYDNYEDVFREY